MTDAVYELGDTPVVLPKINHISPLQQCSDPLTLVKMNVRGSEKLYGFSLSFEGESKSIYFWDRDLDLAQGERDKLIGAINRFYCPVINEVKLEVNRDLIPDSLP